MRLEVKLAVVSGRDGRGWMDDGRRTTDPGQVISSVPRGQDQGRDQGPAVAGG